MPELSDERKRQIREEEEARFRAEQAAEQQYREDVRRQLEKQQQEESEQRYREQVRAELEGTEGSPPTTQAGDEAPAAPVQARDEAPAASVVRRGPSRLGRVAAVVLLIGGVGSIGLAVERGFSVPFLSRGEIVLEAEESGELAPIEEFSAGEGLEATGADVLTSTPAGTAAGERATVGSGSTRSGSGSAGRATLAGTGISIEVPTGWSVEEGDFDEALEIRWGGSGRGDEAAYVLLQRSDPRPGESMEEWAERMVEQLVEAESSEDEVRLEDDRAIADFHGVEALAIDIITSGYMPHHERNYYWLLRGKGYILTCYADTKSFAERAPTFDRMVASMRFSPEGR